MLSYRSDISLEAPSVVFFHNQLSTATMPLQRLPRPATYLVTPPPFSLPLHSHITHHTHTFSPIPQPLTTSCYTFFFLLPSSYHNTPLPLPSTSYYITPLPPSNSPQPSLYHITPLPSCLYLSSPIRSHPATHHIPPPPLHSQYHITPHRHTHIIPSWGFTLAT